MIYTIRDLYDKSVHAQLPDGRWVLSVPLPFYGDQIRAAWAVLCGRAVALRYSVAGELEDVISTPERPPAFGDQ